MRANSLVTCHTSPRSNSSAANSSYQLSCPEAPHYIPQRCDFRALCRTDEGEYKAKNSICFLFAFVLICLSRFSTGAASAVFGPMF
jgi:hypothetical protein